MVDGQGTIQNADVIPLMFGLLPSFKQREKDRLIDEFTKIIEKCPLNQSLCCSKHLIYTLLEIITEYKDNDQMLGKLIALMELLGAHSISVKELKRMFFLLRTDSNDFRVCFIQFNSIPFFPFKLTSD